MVTPATLAVQPQSQPSENTTLSSIPSIDYNISNIEKWAIYEPGSGFGYLGPSSRIRRLITSVASQGSISQISAPHPNCSYVVEFYGPSISCEPLGNSSLKDTITNIVDPPVGSGNIYNYIAWVPQSPSGIVNPLATEVLIGLNASMSQSSTAQQDVSLDTVDDDLARLYVYNDYQGVIEIMECGLYNTSYTVNFTFNNGQQNISVTNTKQLNGLNGTADITAGGDYTVTSWAPYVALMDALGQLLVGYLITSHYGFLGTPMTQVINTVLMDTVEMQSVVSSRKVSPDSLTIAANTTISTAIEQVFRNATISLFSDSYFL